MDHEQNQTSKQVFPTQPLDCPLKFLKGQEEILEELNQLGQVPQR